MHYIVKVIQVCGHTVEHPYVGYAKAFYKYTHMVREQAHHCALVNVACTIELFDSVQGIAVRKTIINSQEI